jgi:hypothetical protein
MVTRLVVRQRLPVAVFIGVVVLFVYLALARAEGVVVGGSMLRAIFSYAFAAGLAVSYALRSALVFLTAFSVAWLALSVLAVRRRA